MKLTKGMGLFIIVLAVCAVIAAVYFVPMQETKGVHIISSIVIGQGALVNDTQNESVTVYGTLVNDGDITAQDLTATVIFTDAAHDKVIMKIVEEGVDLLPNKEMRVEFESEYIRERTEPKTDVNVTLQLDWMVNGESQNLTIGD